MGPCQGVREWQETETPLRRAPAETLDDQVLHLECELTFPLSRERRWGCAGRQVLAVLGCGGPFDRLRANGIGERAFDGE